MKDMTVLTCHFCTKSMKNRGGLSNHMGRYHVQEYITQLKVEREWMEQRLGTFKSREPLSSRDAKPAHSIIIEHNDNIINLPIPEIQRHFSMSIESTFEDLERFEEQRKWLQTQEARFSNQMFAHLMMLVENDIEEVHKAIAWKREYEHDKGLISYHFDASAKADIIAKYEALILQWKEKIDRRTEEAATLEKTGGTYTCDVCNETFKSKGAVTTHVNKAHLEVALKRIDEEEQAGIKSGSKQAEEFKQNILMHMIKGKLGKKEVERIVSLSKEQRMGEKRKVLEEQKVLGEKEDKGDITEKDYDKMDINFASSSLIDSLEQYEEMLARNLAFTSHTIANKKMQLYIFRKEIEPALLWMKVIIKQMGILKFDVHRDWFIESFAKMFKGTVPLDVVSRIDEILSERGL